LRLFAREDGDGAAPIVFLHGFGSCHGLWRPIADALTPERPTIAYDLPGHGASLGWPDAGPAKIAVRAISADLDARGIEKFHLVGHSFGGAVATLLASAKPQSVASLTVLAPGGYGPEINGALLRRYGAAVEPDEIRDCLAAMSGPSSAVPDHAVKVLAQMRRQPGQTEMLARIAADISRDDRQGVISRETLAALAMPVSVMWGTADPLLPYSQTEGLPSQFSLHTAEGFGHMLPEEAPGRVVDVVRRTVG
jgi:pyruvate dehydrogenase E2 component (dihydrolipoamide acetyltransferase)